MERPLPSPQATHTYTTIGEHNATFVVYYSNDKNVTKNVIIKTVDGAKINISYAGGASIGSINNPVSFTHTLPSTLRIADINSFEWAFGDGSTSHIANPRYTYTTAGSYTVTLKIRTKKGTTFNVQKSLRIYSDSQYYIQAVPERGESPLNVKYNIKAINNTDGANHYINAVACTYPDGTTSTLDSFSLDFDREGNFTTRCDVTLSNGSVKTLSKRVEVSNILALEPILSKTEGEAPLSVSFSTQHTIPSGIKSVDWHFGNAITKRGAAVSYTYDTDGIYSGNVTITSNKNHTISKFFSIKVIKPLKVNIFSTRSSNPYKYHFEAVISNLDRDTIKEYWWEFRPGVKQALNQTSAEYTFSTFDSQYIKFYIQFKNGTFKSYSYNLNTMRYNQATIKLMKGWNLISSPVDVSYQVMNSNSFPPIGTANMNVIRNQYVSLIWIYHNGRWFSNPNFIPAKVGIWVKSSVNNNTLRFDSGSVYSPDVGSLPKSKWHLIGTGRDLIDFTNNYSQYISKSITRENGFFYANPYYIKRGQGIWVLTKP